MTRDDALKTILKNSLYAGRTDLMWKLDGLDEHDLRMPRTPTGLNLLGVVKHMAHVEIGYFGDTFDRLWPNPDELITLERFDSEPQADWYAQQSESAAYILDFYRRVWAFADETFDSLPLDAHGTVPHWNATKSSATLQQMMVHVLVDLTRHLEQVDIVREGIDGQVGLNAENPNLPEHQDWDAYLAKLRALAEKPIR